MAETSELVVLFRSLNERAKSEPLEPEEQLAWSSLKSELIEALTAYADSKGGQDPSPTGARQLRLIVRRSG